MLRNGLILLFGFLLAATFTVFGISVGIAIGGESNYAADSLSGWIAAGATLAIAVLTIFLALETYQLRVLQQLQIDDLRKTSIAPDIDVFLQSSAASFQLADLYIKNNGSGVAKNIKISMKLAEDVPENTLSKTILQRLTEPAIIFSGIAALGPARETKSYVLNFIELGTTDDIFEIRIDIKAICKDVDGNICEFETVIDLREQKGLVEVGGRPLYDIANEMKKLTTAVKGVK